MKTAITSKGNGTSAQFDLRFGRAAWFCVIDDETGNTEFFENDCANLSGGAGIKASEKMAELGVAKVISGDFGPKAKEYLNKFNIQMVILSNDSSSIETIISKLKG
ncbi:MAG: dinitrogenase iron-molybdenum cofactor biosynthesis protein [Ignavibacteria bacterium]|nr:dinitrogenase iron-molybdenum cofactor biosynthesis protein [Ignavibacteria bacterium]